MKRKLATTILRLKVAGYAMRSGLLSLLVKSVRKLPGSWTVFNIPRHDIPSIKDWTNEIAGRQNHSGDSATPAFDSFGDPIQVPRANRVHPDVDGVHSELQKKYLEFRAPYLASIPRARILPPHGVVITPDGGIMVESMFDPGAISKDDVYHSLKFPKPRVLSGSYYTIASLTPAGYYHWVIEVLPRLFAYEATAPEHPQLIVNSLQSGFQVESLELLGFPKGALLELDTDHLQLEKLYVPSYIGINPHTLDWLRQRLFAAVDPQPPGESLGKRVYITRRLADKRRIVNENELEQILSEHGFIIAELETLSFAEQVRLFAGAEVIVGLHGAGFTNMVFAPPGCRVLEIVHPGYVNVMFYMLAEVLHQRYWFCTAEAAGDDSLRHGGTHGHGDVVMSVDLFKSSLSEMLGAE